MSAISIQDDAWIETFTGRKLHFMNPTVDEIHLVDFAHSMRNLCRFGGHCEPFYSVCEHSVHVLEWLWDEYHDPGLALQGGLHDATEGYMVDLPSPVKREIPLYKRIENKLQRVIFRRFDLPEDMDYRVHGADARILLTERQQCMSASGHHWTVDGIEPLPVKLVFYPPTREIEDIFKHRIIAMHKKYLQKIHVEGKLLPIHSEYGVIGGLDGVKG